MLKIGLTGSIASGKSTIARKSLDRLLLGELIFADQGKKSGSTRFCIL